MEFTRRLITTVLAAGFLLTGNSALATPITIVNPGFEEDTVPTDPGYLGGVPTGWSYVDFVVPDPITGIKEDVGDDIGSFLPSANIFYPATAPQLRQMAYIAYTPGWSGGTSCFPDPGCSSSDGPYPIGIEQTLGQSLVANSLYELDYTVGNPGNSLVDTYDGFPGYRVELLAGDQVLASHDSIDDSLSVGEGAYASFSLSFVTDGAPLLGALGIRLLNKGAIGTPSGVTLPWFSEVAFDDVSLTVSPVPVPAAVWLFGTALAGLIGFGRRRKTA